MVASRCGIFIVGIYVVDMVFTGRRSPAPGETVAASSFVRGHGGKGSNQAIAAARAGANVSFFTYIGDDKAGDEATALWRKEGIHSHAVRIKGETTGAASIFVDEHTGGNAIVVFAGASRLMRQNSLDQVESVIAESDVFVAQLEQPVQTALRGLQLARKHRVVTLLNPAPAMELPDEIFPLCDYILPNESEAGLLTGLSVKTLEDAETAARRLLAKGVRNVIITLGEKGALFCNATETYLAGPVDAGECVDTTGAGDGFTAGFAVGLARRLAVPDALSFAAALAGISVTRHGATASMPSLSEIEAILEHSNK